MMSVPLKTNGEIPGAAVAVQHLQELACRMKTDHFTSVEKDLLNVNTVIEAIQDLVQECASLHDLLETETIQASVLRYKLKHYPQEIRDEIKRATEAARNSNSDEIDRLRTEWQAIESRISSTQQLLKHLEEDNAYLAPERDHARLQHENVIVQLNQRMSDKANMQIRLNETREKVRETNQQILDLEDGILILQDDLIEERATTRQEKKRLKKEISETVLALEEQRKNNDEKKIERDTQFAAMSVLEKKITDLQQNTVELEGSCNKLEAQESHLQKKVDSTMTSVGVLRRDILNLTNTMAHETEVFLGKKGKLESRIAELDELIGIETQNKAENDAESIRLQNLLQDKMKVRDADAERVKELNQNVQQQKTKLAKTSEKLAELHEDITDIDQKVADLIQSHGTVLESLNKTASEYQKQLGKERLERMELDTELDDVQRGLEFLRSEARRFQERCRNAVVNGKRDHDQLTQDGFRLQTLLKESQDAVKKLQEELVQANMELKHVETFDTREVELVESEIASMTSATESTKAAIESQLPDYEVLQKVFQERSANFDKAKRDLAAMKNKKIILESEIKNTLASIEETTRLQAELKETLSNVRAESMEKLKDSMNQLQELEQQIYVVDCKLEKLVKENMRFTQEISRLEENMNDVDEQRRYNDSTSQKLMLELENMRRQLIESWVNDDAIQRNVTARDTVTADDLGSLRRDTDDRQKVVERVTNNLESELTILTDFLDKVSRRRPTCSESVTPTPPSNVQISTPSTTEQRPSSPI